MGIAGDVGRQGAVYARKPSERLKLNHRVVSREGIQHIGAVMGDRLGTTCEVGGAVRVLNKRPVRIGIAQEYRPIDVEPKVELNRTADRPAQIGFHHKARNPRNAYQRATLIERPTPGPKGSGRNWLSMEVKPVKPCRTLPIAGNRIVGLKHQILRPDAPHVEPPVQLAEGVLIGEAVVHQLLQREPIRLAAGKAGSLKSPDGIRVLRRSLARTLGRRRGLDLTKGSAAQGRRA